MNLENVLAAVGKMFPSANLNGAVQKAQDLIGQTPDNLSGVSAAARNLGITPQTVNEVYQKYGNTLPGRAVCGLLGTTPEALKADAERIVGGSGASFPQAASGKKSSTKFPRLK